MKNVLVITTSLRGNSNSDIFANKVVEGIKDAGNAVEIVSLKGKTIKFCIGCLSCQNTPWRMRRIGAFFRPAEPRP